VSVSTHLAAEDLLNRAIAEHYEEIRRAVMRRGHSSAMAGDIVHDLYVKLAENPDALGKARSIRGFLARAAINLGIDRARRAQFEQKLFSGTEMEAEAVACQDAAPDAVLAMRARLRVLHRAIHELPDRRRAVFILHRLYGLSPGAIATRLRISRNMVDRHLRKAMIHCLERLEEFG